MDADVLVIGEALIDIVESADGVHELVGGSPANVAVGVARQGHATRLFTGIGADARGRRIAAALAQSGVVIDERSWSDSATSTARARLRADGSAEYEFAIDWSVPAIDIGGARSVHTGSIALFLEPGGTAVLEMLRRAGDAFVSIDPNIRPALVGGRDAARTRFAEAAASADLVKLSDEDAAWLYPGVPAASVLAEIHGYGPRLVVMTRGAAGAVGLGPGGITEVPPMTVAVADTIGAGDAYMASLISSVLDDVAMLSQPEAFAAAMRRAAVMAGITVARAGANPPTRAEVDALIGGLPDLTAL